MSHMLQRLGAAFLRVVEAVALVFIFVMMLHTVVNALLRYIFNMPMVGTNELVGNWYLPLVAFLGFIIAKHRGGHIEARLIFDQLSPLNQRSFQLITHVLLLTGTLVFTHYTFREAVHGLEIGMTAGVTNITIGPILFVVPFAFAALALQYALDLVAMLRDPASTGEEGSPARVVSESVPLTEQYSRPQPEPQPMEIRHG